MIEDFKDDKYKISINELLFSPKCRGSIISVQSILDDNGYYGRYKIEQIRDRKFGTDLLLKIHVYLVDSCLTYTWPYNTFFDVDKKMFGHNRRAPRGVISNKLMFGYCVRVLAIIFSPPEILPEPKTIQDLHCFRCREVIIKENIPHENWGWVICKMQSSFGQRPYYEKIIPFLIRMGLIVDNKFKIKSAIDADEFSENLFDIDYWYNS